MCVVVHGVGDWWWRPLKEVAWSRCEAGAGASAHVRRTPVVVCCGTGAACAPCWQHAVLMVRSLADCELPL